MMNNRPTDPVHVRRVMSYNLRDLKDDAGAAARVIRAVNPDVLCLQEVPRHILSGHRIASFATRCGLSWAGGHRGSGGTTLMSSLRLDVTSVRHSELRVRRLSRERGYALGRVQLPGRAGVSVASIHLSLDAVERAAHAATVLGELPADQPLVVAGDLNEESDGQAWSILAERLCVVSGAGPTFPARNPRQRLDAIFASPSLTVVSGEPVELDPADLRAATDHLPVWVDLDFSYVMH